MNNDLLRQRIAYLVTHGGAYPKPRERWVPWAAALLVLQIVTLGIVLFA